jgi:hypothetical protein
MVYARQSICAHSVAAAVITLALCDFASAGLVDLEFSPVAQTVGVCDVFEIDLVMSTSDKAGQDVGGLDALISWDPSVLELLGFTPGAAWSVSGFLNDPDDINDDITDGLALYTALAPPSIPAPAPAAPDTLLVTTFQFRALTQSPPSILALERSFGAFGRTQVLLVATNVTGDISGTSETTVGTCLGDFNVNGSVEFTDLTRLLGAWGPCGDCCAEDLDGGGAVGFTDLTILLAAWGACP